MKNPPDCRSNCDIEGRTGPTAPRVMSSQRILKVHVSSRERDPLAHQRGNYWSLQPRPMLTQGDYLIQICLHEAEQSKTKNKPFKLPCSKEKSLYVLYKKSMRVLRIDKAERFITGPTRAYRQ